MTTTVASCGWCNQTFHEDELIEWTIPSWHTPRRVCPGCADRLYRAQRAAVGEGTVTAPPEVTEAPEATDPAIRPEHYQHPSGVECITVAQHHTFNVGSVFKYLWRTGRKTGEPAVRDLEKARQYLTFEIERLQREAN